MNCPQITVHVTVPQKTPPGVRAAGAGFAGVEVRRMSWVESGRAWGERATDWAYLVEPYARRVNDVLFDRARVGPGTRLLDIACGSGYAANVAAGRGAEVCGLDASAALIAIARARTPAGDFRVGDMFALPFEDGRFDVATSFNGIWKGCEDALVEARRVVRPGGLVGFSFWGSPKRLGLLPYFAALLELSPADHVSATVNQGDTGRPGAAEQMLADAGLEFAGRGTAQVINEFPDLDLAVRALAAAGPSWPALQHVGQDRFAEATREALRPLYTDGLGVRIVSEFGWIIGTVPSA
jgi:SAM-dependent methyltransferase